MFQRMVIITTEKLRVRGSLQEFYRLMNRGAKVGMDLGQPIEVSGDSAHCSFDAIHLPLLTFVQLCS